MIEDMNQDDLGPARGVIIGCALSIFLWGLAIFMLLSWAK